MKTFVFQGDSITDVGRARDNDINIGLGYPFLFAAKMGRDYPEEYAYLNRGISGNRIVDLYARIKSDIINLKPDYLSILIGVNDVWHEFSRHNGVDAEKYEKIYSMLIEEVKQALPDIKIIIMEPFLLKGPATEENWDEFYSEIRKRAVAAKNIAEKYSLEFLPLQDKFFELSKNLPTTYWIRDGVHPTTYGHEFIARELINCFEKIK